MPTYPMTEQDMLLLSYDFEDAVRTRDPHADVFVMHSPDMPNEYILILETFCGREQYAINIKTGEWIKYVA